MHCILQATVPAWPAVTDAGTMGYFHRLRNRTRRHDFLESSLAREEALEKGTDMPAPPVEEFEYHPEVSALKQPLPSAPQKWGVCSFLRAAWAGHACENDHAGDSETCRYMPLTATLFLVRCQAKLAVSFGSTNSATVTKIDGCETIQAQEKGGYSAAGTGVDELEGDAVRVHAPCLLCPLLCNVRIEKNIGLCMCVHLPTFRTRTQPRGTTQT